jgi:hypothetical protein
MREEEEEEEEEGCGGDNFGEIWYPILNTIHSWYRTPIIWSKA